MKMSANKHQPYTHHHLIFIFRWTHSHILFSGLSVHLHFLSLWLPQPPRAPPCQVYILLLLPLLFPLFSVLAHFYHIYSACSPPPLPALHPLPGSISVNFLLLLNWDEGRMEEKIKGWTDELMLGMSANGASVKFALQNCAELHPLFMSWFFCGSFRTELSVFSSFLHPLY